MNRMMSPSPCWTSLQQRLEPLLELAAIFGAGDQRAQVQRQQAPVAQGFRHVAVDDAPGQALGDRGLADAGLADQHRVVLGPARQHLDDAADLLVAADHRVELALARGLGQVARVFLERVVALLGDWRVCAVRPLRMLVDRGVERLRRRRPAGLAPWPRAVSLIASASSSCSTVTKESPAFFATCSAWSNSRAVSGAM